MKTYAVGVGLCAIVLLMGAGCSPQAPLPTVEHDFGTDNEDVASTTTTSIAAPLPSPVVSVENQFVEAQVKAKDAKRLSDIRQIQTALELYYTDNNHYPLATEVQRLGTPEKQCMNAEGFQPSGCKDPYMGIIPLDPPGGPGFYSYLSDGKQMYTIGFYLQHDTGSLKAGFHAGTPWGVVPWEKRNDPPEAYTQPSDDMTGLYDVQPFGL